MGTDRSRLRHRTRLLFGVLAVSLPIMILVVVVLTGAAAQRLDSAVRTQSATGATTAGDRIERWVAERQADVSDVALNAAPVLDQSRALRGVLEAGAEAREDTFDVLFVARPDGAVLSATDESLHFDAGGEDWFEQAANGRPTLSPPYRDDGKLRWIVAAPITEDGDVAAVMVGDLRAEALAGMVDDPGRGPFRETTLVGPDKLLIYSTAFGSASSEEALLAGGALDRRIDTVATNAALAGRTGAGRFLDDGGNGVFGGFAPVDGLGWAVTTTQDVAAALAPVRDQVRLGVAATALGALVLAGAAAVLARRESRRLRLRADDTAQASVAVRSNAEELRTGAWALATSTTAHNADLAGTSATLERLAAAASAIADDTARIASQTAETGHNLGRAQADVQLSSDRALALAERVNGIADVAKLVTEVADQANLLALNAAIEAARAGDEGRGFTVIAEEIRRLAERSKGAAADIARIVEGTQADSNSTVAALEKGAAQLRQSLALLVEVTEAAEKARSTTAQQRSAAEEVVESVGQATQASRQASITAQEFAAAAAGLAGLATDLERTAAATRERL